MALQFQSAACSCPARASQRPVARRTVTLLRSASVSAPSQTQTEASVVSLSSDEYDSFIAQNEVVLVDYYTDWCGPCKMIAPHLEQMAAEMPEVKFAKLNCTTDAAAKKIAMSQGIKALPTFHLFKKNERVGVFVGGKPNQLRKFIEDQLA